MCKKPGKPLAKEFSVKSFLALIFFSFSGSFTQAALTWPYKIIEVRCVAFEHSIVLKWNFSKALYINELLVNGVNELPGSRMSSPRNPDATEYSKAGVYSITIDSCELALGSTRTKATIGSEEFLMECTPHTSWHLTK
jgi:hypothetical protein